MTFHGRPWSLGSGTVITHELYKKRQLLSINITSKAEYCISNCVIIGLGNFRSSKKCVIPSSTDNRSAFSLSPSSSLVRVSTEKINHLFKNCISKKTNFSPDKHVWVLCRPELASKINCPYSTVINKDPNLPFLLK